MADFTLDQFTGPLDLLLGLINEQKMDISEVSLSKVTEQYLNKLEQMEDKQPEELAEFLLVAARLLFLKSKKLLPQFSPEEEEGAFRILFKHEVFGDRMLRRLKDIKSMRNILAHKYGEINDEMVFNSIIEELEEDIKEFIKNIKKLIQ